MKSRGIVLLALAASSLSAFADITIEVTPWSAPNAFGSPSFSGAVSNEEYALMHGLSAFGDPSLPTYFSAVSSLLVSQNIVTGFPSWEGSANPSGDYGADFANELGNRVAFGVLINGNGTPISISQLSFNAMSTDPDNSLDFGFPVGSYNYSNDYKGWNFGTDGLPNTGDDSFVTSGANTQLVDAIVGRGSGNAWAAYDSDPGATRQDKINWAVGGVSPYQFAFTGTYHLQGASGSGSVLFNEGMQPVPEASTLIGAAFLAGATLCRQFRRKASSVC